MSVRSPRRLLRQKSPANLVDKFLRIFNSKNTENNTTRTIMPRSINAVKLLLFACAMDEFECNDKGNVEFTSNQLFQMEKYLEAKDSTIANLDAQNAAHAKTIEAKDAEIEKLNAQIIALNKTLDETPVAISRSNANEKAVDEFKIEATNFDHNQKAKAQLTV